MLNSHFDAQNALPFTGEFETDPHGNVCPVLDIDALDFSNAVMAHKKDVTRVLRVGLEGAVTGQVFDTYPETFTYQAHEGEALFVNAPDDIYVPSDVNGNRLKFDDLAANGYEIVSGGRDDVMVKSPPAALLVAVISERVCLKYRWGEENIPENHQFLNPGATLKKDRHGKVTGFDAHEMEKWEVIGETPSTFFEKHLD